MYIAIIHTVNEEEGSCSRIEHKFNSEYEALKWANDEALHLGKDEELTSITIEKFDR